MIFDIKLKHFVISNGTADPCVKYCTISAEENFGWDEKVFTFKKQTKMIIVSMAPSMSAMRALLYFYLEKYNQK